MEGSVEDDEPKPAASRWQVKKREVLVKNRWHEYRHDTGKTDFGKGYDYYYVYKRHGSVCVVPITTDGNIVMVRQYRYLANADSLELPGGGCEDATPALEMAKLELLQETGFHTENWQNIGNVAVAVGHCTDTMSVYLATACESSQQQQLEETEYGMKVELYPIAEAYRLIDEGGITDSLTIAALALARRHLLKA